MPPALMRDGSLARAERFIYKPAGNPKLSSRKAVNETPRSARKESPRRSSRSRSQLPDPSASPSDAAIPPSPESNRAAKSDKKRRNAKRRGKAKDGAASAFDVLDTLDEGADDEGTPRAAAKSDAIDVGDGSPDAAGALERLVARLETEVERLHLENARLQQQGASGTAPSPAAAAAAPASLARARSFYSHSADALAAAEEQARKHAAESATLRAQLQELTEEASGLRAECSALRSLVMSGGGGDGGASGVAKAEAEAAAARAEAHRLGEENAKLLQQLESGGGSGEAGAGEVGGRGKIGAASSLRKASVPANPAKEKELFAAVGYNLESKGYSKPNLTALRELLQEGAVNLNCRDGRGSPPLAHACYAGSEEAVLLLLAYGADLEAENLDGCSPLHFSVFNKQARSAALLLAAGADASAASDDAGAVGDAATRAVFQAAAQGGRSHLMLQAAAAKVDAMRMEVGAAPGVESEDA